MRLHTLSPFQSTKYQHGSVKHERGSPKICEPFPTLREMDHLVIHEANWPDLSFGIAKQLED